MISFLNAKLWGLVLSSVQQNQKHSISFFVFVFLGKLTGQPFHFHNSRLKKSISNVLETALCVWTLRVATAAVSLSAELKSLLSLCVWKASQSSITYNLATSETIAKDNLLLPSILAYNEIQAQNKGMFYQCNWTAWLQRALPSKLSGRCCAKYCFLCPLINFPLSLNIFIPLHVFSPFWDSFCVLIPARASSYTVLSPSFSFLLSCRLMGGVLAVPWVGVMHYRS